MYHIYTSFIWLGNRTSSQTVFIKTKNNRWENTENWFKEHVKIILLSNIKNY